MSRQDDIKRLIINHKRRLQVLKERKALFGLETPPQILIEIDDIKEKITEREIELEGQKDRTPLSVSIAPIPHNLRRRDEFIGRKREKAEVHAGLQSRSYLISIDGIGGIGKTSLALEVAHEYLHASEGKGPAAGNIIFEGFIWTTAKDRDLTLNTLLDAIARTLGYPGIMQQPVEEKQTAVQKLLRKKPYLLIVDNFETVTDDSIRDFLLKLPEPSKAMVTTREQRLPEVRAISLMGLTESEALALIRSEGERLGLAAVKKAKDQVLLHLYKATDGNPLAIKWAMGQIKQKGQSLDTVLTVLHKARGSIFDYIFTRSWDLLSETARKVLIVMPIFATSASWEGIEAASDVHHFALDEALGQLVEMSLVDATDELERAIRRYNIHPLTRAFAVAQADQSEQMSQFVQAAFERLLVYYKQLFTPPEEIQIDDPYWNGLLNYEGARILEPEWPNLNQLIHQALKEGRDAEALGLFLPTVHLLNAWRLWDERLQLSYEMCAVANRLKDPNEAWLWIDAISYVLCERKRRSEFKEALEKGRLVAHQFNLVDAVMLADAYEAWLYVRPRKQDVRLVQQKLETILKQVDLDSVSECDKVRQIVMSRAAAWASGLYWSQKNLVSAKELKECDLELRRLIGEDTTPVLISLASFSLQLKDIPSAEKFLAQVPPGPRPKDLASLNYTRALVTERKGNTQQARRLGDLALEQAASLGPKRLVKRCRKLLARLSKSTDRPE